MFRKVRLQLGLSQLECAQLLGTSQVQISRIEWGDRTLNTDIAKKFVKIAKERGVVVTLDDIYAD